MNITCDEIEKLAAVMAQHGLNKIKVTGAAGETIELEKNQTAAPVALAGQPAAAAPSVPAAVSPQREEGRYVKSPMVGVFYSAPSPDEDPFVQQGDMVQQGDVLCIIEAMKLMNEIQADEQGEIAEVLVQNGQVVEYGQPLFRLR